MIAGIESFIESSQHARSAEALKELFLGAVESEGYQNAVFARARNRQIVDIPWMRFPDGYAESYVKSQWDKIDPVVQFVHSARRPFAWADVFGKTRLTSAQKSFLGGCRELGVHTGLTIPLHGPGTDVDLVSLSLRDERIARPDRIPMLLAITTQYRMRLSDLENTTQHQCEELTMKEIECLRWCKEGKTNWEIGGILSISEKTVEFHVSNTIRKLRVSNRLTAVVKGIQTGIISM